MQIAGIDVGEETLTVRLRDAHAVARVHVFATRYEPAFGAFATLGKVRAAELQGVLPSHAESGYLSGRNIGDEYRYVLDRRGQKKFPGNMLARPSVLLNPWAVRSAETGEQTARTGEDFAAKGTPPPATPVPAPPAPPGAAVGAGPPPAGTSPTSTSWPSRRPCWPTSSRTRTASSAIAPEGPRQPRHGDGRRRRSRWPRRCGT